MPTTSSAGLRVLMTRHIFVLPEGDFPTSSNLMNDSTDLWPIRCLAIFLILQCLVNSLFTCTVKLTPTRAGTFGHALNGLIGGLQALAKAGNSAGVHYGVSYKITILRRPCKGYAKGSIPRWGNIFNDERDLHHVFCIPDQDLVLQPV